MGTTEEYGRIPARIGNISFIYEDPSVDVTTEQHTIEHETIDDTVVVQTMGRKPTQLTIRGAVVDLQLDALDGQDCV